MLTGRHFCSFIINSKRFTFLNINEIFLNVRILNIILIFIYYLNRIYLHKTKSYPSIIIIKGMLKKFLKVLMK